MMQVRIISASAGSGKTTRLASEIASAVIDRGVRPESILATTFTRHAAGELVERARTHLLSGGATEEAERLGAARIGTVNSVCGQLVRDFALELGISPGLQVLDEVQARVAFAKCLSQAISPGERRTLNDIGRRFEDFRPNRMIRSIVDAARVNRIAAADLEASRTKSIETYRNLLAPSAGVEAEIDAAVADALRAYVAGIEPLIADGTDSTKKTEGAFRSARYLLGGLETRGFLTWSSWARLTRLDASQKCAELTEMLYAAAQAYHHHPRFHRDIELAITNCFTVAAKAMSLYEEHKRRSHTIDFVDQEAFALSLLEREPVREHLSDEVSLVLVDEFQDTSPIQLALFLQLAKVADQSIWVGDQKQSIFGFRGTDPALMNAAIDSLTASDSVETLDKSWRSRPPLVEATSALFPEPFGRQGIPAERVALAAGVEEDDPDLGPAAERWVLQSKKAENDIKAIADGVKQLVDDKQARVRDRSTGQTRPLTPSDVAVLCRRNKERNLLGDELAALGVPIILPRAGLLQTLEGRALHAALRRWTDQRDRLAAAELARLLVYADDEEAWLTAAITDRGSSFADERTLERLREASEANAHAGPTEACDRAIAALDIRERCLSWGDSSQRLANLDAFRAHVVAFEDSCRSSGELPTLVGAVAYLDELSASGGDSQAVLEGSDGVTLSTWHAAKGLEWPVTVLAQLDLDPIQRAFDVHVDSETDEIDFEAPLAGRWIRYWPQPFTSRQTRNLVHDRLAVDPYAQRAVERAFAQELRLLYVGWTRARDRVVLAARPRLNAGILNLLTANDGRNLLADVHSPEEEDEQTDISEVHWAGVPVSVRLRTCAPRDAIETPREPGSGYLQSSPREFPERFRAPSSSKDAGHVGEPIVCGPGFSLLGSVDMRVFGTAFHAFLAADRATESLDARAQLAAAHLDRHGLADAASPAALVQASDALRTTLKQRFPKAVWHREWPVAQLLDDGAQMRGVIDLLLETEDGFVVVDHKSFPGDVDAARERAGEYAGQLAAYSGAIEAATGRPVLAQLIHFPLSGVLVPVGLDDAEERTAEKSTPPAAPPEPQPSRPTFEPPPVPRRLVAAMARLGVGTLGDWLGRGTLELLEELQPEALSASRLASLLVRQQGADGILLDKERRSAVFRGLPQGAAEDLAGRLGLRSDDPWAALEPLRFRKDSERTATLFAFFDAPPPSNDEEEEKRAPPRSAVSPAYPLFAHQRRAYMKVIRDLSEGDRPRVLLHMPTGAGKTRVAMNVVSHFLRDRLNDDEVVVWLAHTEELCEQAGQEFERAWQAVGNRQTVVHRHYGSHRIELDEVSGGLLVAGTQLLYEHSLSRQSEFLEMSRKSVKLVVLDEAHLATAPTYKHLLNLLATSHDTAVLGLSATPGRGVVGADTTEELATYFNRRKVQLEVEGFDNPVEFLQSEGYLAEVDYDHIPYRRPDGFQLSPREAREIEEAFDYSPAFIKRLGEDHQRNLLILSHIIQEAEAGRKIIVFGCSVDHANMLAELLRTRGFTAASVTGATPRDVRRSLIERYRDTDDIQILTNFGVLTTGFDAPRTNVAVIARPTRSVVLYSQMVGRAARGWRAGGNKSCRVITVVDDLPGFRSIAESFTHWNDIWT